MSVYFAIGNFHPFRSLPVSVRKFKFQWHIFCKSNLFSEMLLKTISDDHMTETFNTGRPINKVTNRHKLCALVPYGSALKAHLPGLNWYQSMSDCIKTFGAFDWQIKAVGNISWINLFQRIPFIGSIKSLAKNVTFWIEGTFSQTAPIQAIGIIVK